MKGIVSRLITRVFSNYINPIQGYQLDVAIWQGNAQLQDVIIKPTALSNHDLPFTIPEGIIKSISIHIPWSNIKSQSCEIDINGVYIRARLATDQLIGSDLHVKQSVLQELDKELEEEQSQNSGKLSGFFTLLVDNIVFKIRNVHIRLEMMIGDRLFASGIIIKSIESLPIDSSGQRIFISSMKGECYRKLELVGLSVYIDANAEEMPISYMSREFEHDCLLKDFSLSLKWKRNDFDVSEIRNEVECRIESLNLSITRDQYFAIQKLKNETTRIQIRKQFYRCGRPSALPEDEKDCREWWRFLHRCTVQKRYPNRLQVNEVINMLKYRTVYCQLWEISKNMTQKNFKNSNECHTLKSLENDIDLNTILFLRLYSDGVINRKKASRTAFISDEWQSFTKSVNQSTSSLRISFDIGEIVCSAFSVVNIKLQNVAGSVTKLGGVMDCLVSCKKFMILYNEDVIINQRDSADALSLKYSSNSKTGEQVVDAVISDPEVYLDFDVFNQIREAIPNRKEFVEFDYGSDQSRFEVTKTKAYYQKLCENHTDIEVNLRVNIPKIVFAGSSLEVGLDSVVINSKPIHDRKLQDINSRYDFYSVHLNGFSASIKDHVICHPVSTVVEFQKAFMDYENIPDSITQISMTKMEVCLSRQNYLEICKLVNMISSRNRGEKSQKQKSSANTTHKITAMFEKFALKLSDSESEGSSAFDVSSLSIRGNVGEMLTLDIGIGNIGCTSRHGENLISFRGEEAISAKYAVNNDSSSLTATLFEPIMTLDFQCIEELLSFFAPETAAQKTMKGSGTGQGALSVYVEMKSPNVVIVVPTFTSRRMVEIAFDKLVYDNGSVLMKDMMTSFDSRILSKAPATMTFSKDGNTGFTKSGDMHLVLIDSDYQYIIELSNYIMAKYAQYFPPKPDKPSDFRSVVSFTSVSLEFAILTFNIDKLEVVTDINGMVLTGASISMDRPDGKQYGILHDMFLKRVGNKIDISFRDKPLLNAYKDTTNWVYRLTAKASPIINYKSPFPPLTNPIITEIRMTNPVIVLLDETVEYGRVYTTESIMCSSYLPSKNSFSMKLQNLKITSTVFDREFTFLDIGSDRYFNFHFSETKKMTISSDFVYMGFSYPHLMKIVSYATGITSNQTHDPDSPLTMTLMAYDCSFKTLVVKALYQKNDEVRGFEHRIESFHFQNEKDLAEYVITGDKYVSGLCDLDKLELKIEFILSKSLPPLIDASNSHVLSKFESVDKLWLHGMNMSVGGNHVNMRSFMHDDIISLLDSIEFIFVKNGNYLYQQKQHTSVLIDTIRYQMLYNREFCISNLKYDLEKLEHTVSINSISFVPNPQLFGKTSEDDFLKLRYGEKGCLIDLNNVSVKLDYAVMMSIVNELVGNPFVTYRVGPKKEPNPDLKTIININGFTGFVPHEDICLSVVLRGKMMFSLKELDVGIDIHSLAFLDQNMKKGASICSSGTLRFKKIADVYQVAVKDFDANISYYDIQDIKSIITSFPRDKTQKPRNKTVFKCIDLDISPCVVSYCKEWRSYRCKVPLVRVISPPIRNKLVFGKVNEWDLLNTSFDCFNAKTGHWDPIVEPISVTLVMNIGEKGASVDLRIPDTQALSVNIVHYMIKSIMGIMDLPSKDTTNGTTRLPDYIIENNSGKQMMIISHDGKEQYVSPGQKIILPTEQDFSVASADAVYNIRPSHLRKFPMFLSSKLSAALYYKSQFPGIRMISISSILAFDNKTDFTFQLTSLCRSGSTQSLELPAGVKTYFPFGKDEIQSFSIVSANSPGTGRRIKLEKIRKHRITIPVMIGNVAETFCCDWEFNPTTCNAIVTLAPRVFIGNSLSDMSASVAVHETRRTFTLKRGKTCAIYGLDIKESKTVTLSFMIGSMKSQVVSVDLVPNKVFPVKFDGTYCLGIFVKKMRKHGEFLLTLFSPGLLVNKTSLMLFAFDVSKKPVARFMSGTTSAFGCLSYFDTKTPNMSLYLTVPGYSVSSNPVTTMLSGFDSTVFLKSETVKELSLPLKVRTKRIGVDPRTSLLEISHHLTVRNTSSRRIRIHAHKGNSPIGPVVDLPTDAEVPILLSTEDFMFLVAVDDLPPVVTSLGVPGRTTLRVPSGRCVFVYIDLVIQLRSDGIRAVLSEAILPQPLMISNCLERYCVCCCYDMESVPTVCQPMTTTLVASDSCEPQEKVFILAEKDVFTINLRELSHPVSFSTATNLLLVIEVKLLETGSRLITISPNQPEEISQYELSLSLAIPRIMVSVIDDEMRELALVTFTGTELNYNVKNGTGALALTLGAFQLDDMHPTAPITVVMCSDPSSKFLQFTSLSLAKPFMRSFNCIAVNISKLTANIDINFISEVLHFAKSLASEKHDHRLVSNDPTQIPLLAFDQLTFEQFSVTFSVRTSTGRPLSHPLDPFLAMFIPSITEAVIRVPSQMFARLSGTTEYISSVILSNLKSSVMSQALSIIGRTDALAAIGILPSLVKNVTMIGSGRFDDVSPSVLPGAEGLLRTASSALNMGATDRRRGAEGVNRTALETIGDGVAGLGTGILSGFRGIVADPINGAKKRGAVGAITGAVKGIVGVVTRPVSGVLDVGAGIVGGVRKSFSSGVVVSRVRIPRAFLMGEIRPFAEIVSRALLNFQKVSDEFENERMMCFVTMFNNVGYTGVTENYIVFYRENATVMNYTPLIHVKSVKQDGSKITIDVGKKQMIELKCLSPDAAVTSARIIHSCSVINHILE